MAGRWGSIPTLLLIRSSIFTLGRAFLLPPADSVTSRERHNQKPLTNVGHSPIPKIWYHTPSTVQYNPRSFIHTQSHHHNGRNKCRQRRQQRTNGPERRNQRGLRQLAPVIITSTHSRVWTPMERMRLLQRPAGCPGWTRSQVVQSSLSHSPFRSNDTRPVRSLCPSRVEEMRYSRLQAGQLGLVLSTNLHSLAGTRL